MEFVDQSPNRLMSRVKEYRHKCSKAQGSNIVFSGKIFSSDVWKIFKTKICMTIFYNAKITQLHYDQESIAYIVVTCTSYM